jgi:hypothetical protein
MKRIVLAVLTVSVFVAASLVAGGAADAKKMKKMKMAKMSGSEACLAKGKMVGRDEQRTFVVSDCMKGMK